MKNRIFEFWKYDAASCKEATNHLNEMSKNGYELKGISRTFALAGYTKVGETSNKRYTVVINDTHEDYQEDNLIYYENREGMSVYEGNPTGFNEDESFNHLRNNILRKQRKETPFDLIILAFALYRGFPTGFGEMPYMEYFTTLLFWLVLVTIVVRGRVIRFINRKEYDLLERSTSFEDIHSRAYKVYREKDIRIPYIVAALMVSIFVITLIMLMTADEPYMVIGMTSVLVGISMIILSPYFIFSFKNRDLEKGLLVMGSGTIFLGFLFTASNVGLNLALLVVFLTLI